MFSSLFRGKKANTRNTTRRNTAFKSRQSRVANIFRAPESPHNNLRNIADKQAYWKIRSKGRGPQHRMANLFHPEEGPHNNVAKEQKRLAEEIFNELDAIAKGITPEQQKEISDLHVTLQEQVQGAVQSGAQRMTITVPTFVGQILIRLLGVLIVSLFVGSGLFFTGGVSLALSGVGAAAAGAGIMSGMLMNRVEAKEKQKFNPRNTKKLIAKGLNTSNVQWQGASTGAVPTAVTMAENNPNGTLPAYYTRRNRRNA